MIYKPEIKFNSDILKTNNLTFVLVDCDSPNQLNIPSPYILWKVYHNTFSIILNIYYYYSSDNFGTDLEVETHSYIPPLPERGSGVHRIIGVLLNNYPAQQLDRE